VCFSVLQCVVVEIPGSFAEIPNPFADVGGVFDKQNTTTHCETLRHTATHCCNTPDVCVSFSEEPDTHCNTLQHTALHRNTPYVSGSCAEEPKIDCNTLQHTGGVRLICREAHVQRCSQHTATHCNTLQHTLHTRFIRRICRGAHNTLQHTSIH